MVDSQSGKRLIYYASKKQQVNWDMGVQWDGIVECMDFDALLALPKNNPERSPDGIVIAFNDEAEMTEDSGSKLAELRDYCQLRYIPVVVIAEQNMLELKRTLLPEALLHPSEKVELQLYIHKLLKQRESIISQLLIDPVTGLYNSRYLHKEVQTLLDDMKRAFEPFTLIYVHRDNKLTDHLINMITHAIRPTDRVALHAKGGLVIVLPRTSRDDAHKLLNRLNEQIALSAHVREFSDATLSVEQCLDIVTLTDDSYHHDHKGARKLNIAIIDDDRLIREMLKHQLADIGDDQFDIEVRTYADGELFLTMLGTDKMYNISCLSIASCLRWKV